MILGMEFTSESGLFEFTASLIAAISTILGVIGSINQLSKSARARRTVEWINASISADASDCNSKKWNAIKASEEAYLVASHYIGGWQPVATAAWIVVSPLFVLATIFYDGTPTKIAILSYFLLVLSALSYEEIKAEFNRKEIVEHYVANMRFGTNDGEKKCHPIRFASFRFACALMLYGDLSLIVLCAQSAILAVLFNLLAWTGGILLFSSMLPPTKAWWMKKFIKHQKKVKCMSVTLPEPEYLQRVGEMAYAASYLEWTLLGDLNRLSDRLPDDFSLDALEQKTMGCISSMTKQAAEYCTNPEIRCYLETTARALDVIKGVRNDVLHARPATMSPGEKQRLYRAGANGQRFWIDDEWLDRKLDEVDQAIKGVNAVRPPFTG